MTNPRPLFYCLWLLALLLLGAALAYGIFSQREIVQLRLPVPQQVDFSLPDTPIPSFDSQTAHYVLTAWSEQGMQYMVDSAQIIMLREGSTLNAQLIQRGPGPRVVTEGVSLHYNVAPATLAAAIPNPAPLQGALMLLPDTALFQRDSLPVSPYSRDGNGINPYPVVQVEAWDVDGTVLASTTALLPVSAELGCRNCHGGPWESPLGKSTAGMGLSTETSKNILARHDRINATTLVQQAATEPVLCTSCHSSAQEATTQLSLSAAIHGWHASYLPNKGSDACNSCHPSDPMGITQFWRDRHSNNGLSCTHCHGYLEDHAIALLKGETARSPRAGVLLAPLQARSVANATLVLPRQAWINLPDCASCHDFETKPDTATTTAFNKWTENAETLYKVSTDYTGMLYCAGCHGTQHALYPTVATFMDAVQPWQYQNNPRTLGAAGNCFVCHAEPMDMPPIHHPLVTRATQIISVPAQAELMMDKVAFPHELHQEKLDCESCHHMGFAEDGNMSCTKAGCHDSPGASDASPDISYFRTAFHGAERGCQPCHEQRFAVGVAAGPRDCIGCHSVAQKTARIAGQTE